MYSMFEGSRKAPFLFTCEKNMMRYEVLRDTIYYQSMLLLMITLVPLPDFAAALGGILMVGLYDTVKFSIRILT